MFYNNYTKQKHYFFAFIDLKYTLDLQLTKQKKRDFL